MIKKFIQSFALITASFSLLPQATAEAFRPYNLQKGIALQGYDPTSYFNAKAPQKGIEKHKYDLAGATYLFANEANLNEFKASPEKFLPQYGGWCAFAMADAEYVDVDPETYKTKDGKLYLFYNGWLGNTLKKWNKDENNLHTKADASWSKLKGAQ